MIDWITNMFASISLSDVLIWLGIFLLTFVGNLAIVSFVLVKLPQNYFQEGYSREFWTDQHRFLRWGGLILKNLLGAVLVVVGVVLSLPGVPGQGILTILLGLIMLDIPGKRPIEARLIKRPSVLNAINRLRARFDKPPLVLD